MSNINDVAPEISRRSAPVETETVTRFWVERSMGGEWGLHHPSWSHDTVKDAIESMIRTLGIRRSRQTAPSLKYRVVKRVTTLETTVMTSEDQSAVARPLGAHLDSVTAALPDEHPDVATVPLAFHQRWSLAMEKRALRSIVDKPVTTLEGLLAEALITALERQENQS
jgi:hypothetical protein